MLHPPCLEVGKSFGAAVADAGVHLGSYRGFWHGIAADRAVVLTAWVPNDFASTGKASLTAHVKPSFAAAHLALGSIVRVVMVRRSGTDLQGHAIPGIAAALPGTFNVAAIAPAPDADYLDRASDPEPGSQLDTSILGGVRANSAR